MSSSNSPIETISIPLFFGEIIRNVGSFVQEFDDFNVTSLTSQEEGIPRLQIQSKHFDYAFDHVLPSVSKKDQARYDRMRDRMARARSRGGGVSGEADVDGDASKNDEQSKAAGSEEAPPTAK